MTPEREETLRIATELGASAEVLQRLTKAGRVQRNSRSIVLPAGRLEHLSRGRG